MRTAIQKLNLRLMEIEIPSKGLQKSVKELQAMAGTSRAGKSFIGLGRNLRTKAQMEAFTKELRFVLSAETESKTAIKVAKDKELKAYRKFKKNHGNLTYKSWRSMVDFAGTMQSVLTSLHIASEDFVELYKTARKHKIKATDLVKAFNDTTKDIKRRGGVDRDITLSMLYDAAGIRKR